MSNLAELATLAEKYYKSDPNISLFKCRQFVEVCAKYVSAQIGIYEEVKNEKLIYIINQLRKKKAIQDRIYYLLNDARNLANSEVYLDAQHSTTTNPEKNNKINSNIALKCVKKIHKLAIWYHKAFCSDKNKPFKEPEYIIPIGLEDKIRELEARLISQNEPKLIKEIEEEIEYVQLKKEEEEKIMAQSNHDLDDHLQSSDLDEELTRIFQETTLKPEVIKSNLSNAAKAENDTILGDNNIIRTTEINKLAQGLILRHRYKIIEELSSGSFGTTYIAHDLDKPNKPLCVVKQFTPKQSDSGTFSKARCLFNQEAEILQKLGTHTEVPCLLAFFEDNHNLFLVQEYIEGYILREELTIQSEEKQVIQLLKDILNPLSYVHQTEIVHRDIKPENLIRRAIDDKIVIIDFGAVKQILKQKNTKGTVIGTKAYMSPEQFKGQITYSCDVYAVGIIAIEALTGRRMPENIYPKQYLASINFISDGFKEILLNMTAINYEDRYSSAQEVLRAIEEWEEKENETPTKISQPLTSQDNSNLITIPEPRGSISEQPLQSPVSGEKTPKTLIEQIRSIPLAFKLGGGIVALLLLGLFIKSIPYLTKTKLAQTELTIGTLWTPESLQGLTEHIEENSVPANYFDFLSGKKIKVLTNGNKSIPYGEAQKRIEVKQWDIAFANSPMLSIFAKEQGYTHIAGMFPKTPNYQAGLFVKNNSSIQSLNDIKTSTRVALGGFYSASSFYMPVYDLYGKTITADTGNRGQAIIELVRDGKTDVGAAAIGDSIRKDDPDFRIIHVSRNIPSSGVYASPDLSESDQQNIKKLMLTASDEVQKKANYGDRAEADFTEFKKIVERVGEILICTDFNKNPVTLACTGNIETLEGKINGASIEGNNAILKLSANNQIYNLSLSLKITQELFDSDKLTDIQGKSVIVKTNQINGNNVKINQTNQLKVKNN